MLYFSSRILLRNNNNDTILQNTTVYYGKSKQLLLHKLAIIWPYASEIYKRKFRYIQLYNFIFFFTFL